MVSSSNSSEVRITLRAPVIMMVLAATAIPVELRPPGRATPDFSIHIYDIVENIAGYVPVGIVLGGLGRLRAVIAAALISTFAESSQFVMMHRDPSAIDIATNVIGAALGTVICERWRIYSAGLRVNTSNALIAATLASLIVLGVWANRGDALNSRGATLPGTLEAYWKFDEGRDGAAIDSSGHGLHGKFRNQAKHVAGVIGSAITLDGVTDYINFGHSSAFRLVGSMTISAWIKPTSFPVDDAAIVSNYDDLGYQLDTTVDRGPRTIGFKLADACGNIMARYGATPLVTDTWYYVAGVYNAEARTLDVYLNGKPDNGFLRGTVTGIQRSSREAVYIGRRSDATGYEFAGSIDDVRIYSRALTTAEVVADMHGAAIDAVAVQRGAHSRHNGERPQNLKTPCIGLTDEEDAKSPGAAAMFGVLVAIACAGFWPSAGSLLCVIVSFAAGLLFLPIVASTLPVWIMPLVSLAGGVSVAVSVRRQSAPA